MKAYALCTRRQRLAALALALCLSAAAPPLASADETAPALPLPTAPDAAGIAAVVEAGVAAAVEVELPAVAEAPPESVPLPEAEPPAPLPETGPEAPVAPQQPPAATAAQQSPVNVNVSVRIESPGDDGAVTQTNAAVTVTSTPVEHTPDAAVPDTRYQEPAPQYQPPTTSVSAPEPNEPPTRPETASVPATWTWNWDCAAGLPPEFDLPAGSLPGLWVWNWSGNCSEYETSDQNEAQQSAPQYQPGITQYQPVNVNVAIRVASPGSNGPVVQANVAVAVVVPPPPRVVVPGLPPAVEPAPEVTQPAAAPAGAAPAVSEPIRPAPVVELPAGETPCVSELPLGEPACTSRSDSSPVDAVPATSGTGARAGSSSVERELAAAGTAGARLELTARLVATLAPPRPALEAAARARVPERQGQHRSRLPDLTRQPASSLGLMAPERAGRDLSPFLIFVFLAAFVFAFADAAWRVRDGWWPAAAEPGRRRERPG